MVHSATVPPGPRGAPVIGSALELQRDILGTYERARRRYGDVVRFVIGPPGMRSMFYLVFAPPRGAVVTLGDPPLLRWTPIRGARYYNVQLFRKGRKILKRLAVSPEISAQAALDIPRRAPEARGRPLSLGRVARFRSALEGRLRQTNRSRQVCR
jgi:hypothetical protein